MALNLHLFGGFEARRDDGAPVVFARKKAQALLAYLALHPGQSQSRSKLAALLWSDVPEPAARAGIRQALVVLRRAVGPAGQITTDSDTVRLEADGVAVDVAQFERLAADTNPAALVEAAALYRGHLLEGLRGQSAAFEEWLLAERERLHEMALEVHGRLLTDQTTRGEFDAAVQTSVRLLALDPLQEAVHRALMRLYVRQGRRAAALRQYQTCVDVVQRELNAEPEPATKRLYRDLLLTAPAADAGHRAERGGAAGPPLVGRGAELVRLGAALDDVGRGRGRTVLLVGEAGIGKSRLAAELADLASGRNFQVLVGHAYESEEVLPFGVWVNALRSGGVMSADLLQDLEEVWRLELGRLFPELAGRQAARTGGEEHLRLFEAMGRLLLHLSRRRPIVLVLEDLHWADAMSVRLLAFLARRIADYPVLLAGTVRDEDVPETSALASVLDEIARERSADSLSLTPLSRDETSALVSAHVGGRQGAGALVKRVWLLSEGNPFVAIEAARAFADGAPDLLSEKGPLPDRVRQMIRRRLDRLPQSARKLAEAAAVIGVDFDFRLLREVVGMNEHEAAEGLEELVRRRVVRLAGDTFVFSHDRLRQATYDMLLPPSRIALHRAVAVAIERLAGDRLEESYDRLGHHYAHAEDAERAVDYLARFAEQAGRRYALEEAAAALDHARSFVDRLTPSTRDERLLELLVPQAIYLFFLGRFQAVMDLLGRHQDLVDRVGDHVLAGPYHAWLALTWSLAGQHAAAVEHAERARAAAARAGDTTTEGQACAVLALSAFWSGTPSRGIEHAQEAVNLLAGGESVEWRFFAHLYLAVNCVQLGQLQAARAANLSAASVAEAADSARLRTFAAWSTGWAEAALGNHEAAVEACRRAVALAPDPLGAANALGFLGYAHLEGGNPAAAQTALEQAVSRSAEFGFRPQQGWFSAWLAEAYLSTGNAARARDLSREAVGIARQVGFPYGVGVALRALGRAALAGAELAAADAALAEALAMFESIPARYEAARTRLDLCRLWQARGLPAAARQEFTAATAAFVTLDLGAWVGRATELVGSAISGSGVKSVEPPASVVPPSSSGH